MDEEYTKLEEEQTRLYLELSRLIKKDKKGEFYKIIRLFVDNEIEMEKYCNG